MNNAAEPMQIGQGHATLPSAARLPMARLSLPFFSNLSLENATKIISYLSSYK